jgi:hypothetical protein
MSNDIPQIQLYPKGDAFFVVRPTLVKPLQRSEQQALIQHGCTVVQFPDVAKQRPDMLKGHMVTFPPGTIMVAVTPNQYQMRFPDNYSLTLMVQEGWYYFYPELEARHD